MKLILLIGLLLGSGVSPEADVPQSFDWRERGVISEVKNQGSCEGTFYFAAVGTLESYYYLKTGQKVRLSEQSILDCSLGHNNGCNGGGVLNSIDFVRTRGVYFEEAYPYSGVLGNCQMDSSLSILKTIGYMMLPRDEEEIKKVVATIGPVAVTFDGQNLGSYTMGIYKDPSCSSNLQTRSGIIVGYGATADGEEYWIIKMPYGPNWGENGYFRLARNADNLCGVANNAIYPLL